MWTWKDRSLPNVHVTKYISLIKQNGPQMERGCQKCPHTLWMTFYAHYVDDIAVHKKAKYFCMCKTRVCLNNAMLLDE